MTRTYTKQVHQSTTLLSCSQLWQ